MIVKIQANNYKNLSASTNSVKGGQGVLKGIFVNQTTSGTIKIYDALTQTGTVLNNTITFASVGYYPLGDAAFTVGLSVTVGGTLDCTLYWQ